MTALIQPRLAVGHQLAAAQRKFPILQMLVLAALMLYVGQADGDFSWNDLWAPILLQGSFLGIAAAGQPLVILLGGLDFSIAAFLPGQAAAVRGLVGSGALVLRGLRDRLRTRAGLRARSVGQPVDRCGGAPVRWYSVRGCQSRRAIRTAAAADPAGQDDQAQGAA
jgi:hypothetical protein